MIIYIYIYALFVLAKWSIVKCRTSSWLLVDSCCFPCKDEGDQFWRCFKFPLYACSMPSNPKRCKSLRGVLMNSGDIVLHHFATFETRLWPTKMPTRIAYGHSRICDLVRSRKVGCSSLIAKEHGISARVANKLWKPRFDRPRSSSKFVRHVGIYILMISDATLEKPSCEPAMSIAE